ncbi:hypothetical protein CPB86DRAFT_781468 [Serendipita vermifera]|nr:hypothetical protein CPB86DRAFT_781468 [Serendipita vermifera]
MDVVLKILRTYPTEPSLPQTKEACQKQLPSLPVEIWLIIFQMTLRPSLIIDAQFQPFEIELAHAYLDSNGTTSDKASQKMVSRSKRNLRGVCRSWKELADNIDVSEDHWAWDVTCREGAPPITDPDQRPRLNQHHDIPSGSQINGRYTHPVSTLVIDVGSHNHRHRGRIYMTSLRGTISFPEHLRVLNLRFEHFNASRNVLRDIEGMRIPLTTLGLHANSAVILQTSLEIPTLISLFITVPEYVITSWNEQPDHFRWKFPNLRNLWWEDQRLSYINSLRGGHPLFLHILRDHFKSIRTLRTCPITREIADDDSPLCWTKMPNLQSLATKFYRVEETSHKYEIQGHSDAAIESDSVLYLVVLDTSETKSQDVVDGLQKYIHICKNLRAIYLSGHDPVYFKRYGWGFFQLPYPSNWWSTGAIQRLQSLCQIKSINIKYKKDEEFVDISPPPN